MKTLECDFLVMGSGLAGLMSALHLSKRGEVILATKKKPDNSNTDWAQGGIAGVVDPGDDLSLHIADTLQTGGGICQEEVVRQILEAGPECIAELEDLGVGFARTSGGAYELGREAGHSRRRILHAGDITGHEIVKALLAHVSTHPRIQVLSHVMAIDLVTTGWMRRPGKSRCIGGYFMDVEHDEIIAIKAPYTVLATGGAGKVYLYTSNPDVATGDGIAMAWRAGLPIKNMEMIQFHPTCLYHPEAKSFLISEAVRGEGARLINEAGEAFMTAYDPQGELAPRDIVARAIDDQMKKRGDTCVYLDITHRSKAFLQERFPNIYKVCETYGYAMERDPIPVVPAAHYVCGGVEAEVNGRTALPGLFACGEVTCTGLHGANRLASNSLLEALVCAREAAKTIVAEYDGQRVKETIPNWQKWDAVPSDEAVVVEHNWNEVRTCMWDYVGIVRTDKRLERAKRRLENLRDEIRQYYMTYEVTPDVLELRNITAVALLIVRCALMRKESRGLHFTLDHPILDSAWQRDTRIDDPPGGMP